VNRASVGPAIAVPTSQGTWSPSCGTSAARQSSWASRSAADPRVEGEKIIAGMSPGLGELVVLEGAGHYPHAQTPNELLALTLPFLKRTARA